MTQELNFKYETIKRIVANNRDLNKDSIYDGLTDDQIGFYNGVVSGMFEI